MSLRYVKSSNISLRNHPQFSEAWLQEQIKDDPSLLGLGDLVVIESERRQPSGGRLDLLLADINEGVRYEVELMLGQTDESHIIRCLEYWDTERKRYPNYDHVAVLVAEDITTRFLNVIGLFNSAIPIIAIQLNALEIEEKATLTFTKVLDVIERGEDDEGLEQAKSVDRGYWVEKGSEPTVALAEQCMEVISQFAPDLSLTFKQQFMGLSDGYRARNFVRFIPRKNFLRLNVRISKPDAWADRLNESEIVTTPGARHRGRLILQLRENDLSNCGDLLRELFEASFQEYSA